MILNRTIILFLDRNILFELILVVVKMHTFQRRLSIATNAFFFASPKQWQQDFLRSLCGCPEINVPIIYIFYSQHILYRKSEYKYGVNITIYHNIEITYASWLSRLLVGKVHEVFPVRYSSLKYLIPPIFFLDIQCKAVFRIRIRIIWPDPDPLQETWIRFRIARKIVVANKNKPKI